VRPVPSQPIKIIHGQKGLQMAFIELNMVIPARQAHIYDEVEVGSADDGEDDGIVQLHPNAQSAPQTETTTPATINSDMIKSFYHRKKRQDGSQPTGTRINFLNGSGMAVTNTYLEVRELLTGDGVIR
jgi:hypothetical protein